MGNDSKNMISNILFVIGICEIVIGFLGACFLGEALGAAVFLAGAIGSSVSGMLIIGLSEVIKILDDSRKYLEAIMLGRSAPDSLSTDNISAELPEI
jgi:hypothetical protein